MHDTKLDDEARDLLQRWADAPSALSEYSTDIPVDEQLRQEQKRHRAEAVRNRVNRNIRAIDQKAGSRKLTKAEKKQRKRQQQLGRIS